MGIKIGIEITSPLTDDDKELLSGIAVMTLAIANRELAKQGFPDTFPDEDPEAEPPGDCGAVDGEGGSCISLVGHMGRHTYRPQPWPNDDGHRTHARLHRRRARCHASSHPSALATAPAATVSRPRVQRTTASGW
jgi:hypothetical protein